MARLPLYSSNFFVQLCSSLFGCLRQWISASSGPSFPPSDSHSRCPPPSNLFQPAPFSVQFPDCSILFVQIPVFSLLSFSFIPQSSDLFSLPQPDWNFQFDSTGGRCLKTRIEVAAFGSTVAAESRNKPTKTYHKLHKKSGLSPLSWRNRPSPEKGNPSHSA
jgi:hypothetical protein